jgi:sulfide:quinone oxidoreductase
LIVGGGSGGCGTAAKFCRSLGAGQVVVLDPKDRHYYQPYFTLVGGGLKKFENSWRPMKSTLPKKARWLHDLAIKFDPENNAVYTRKGDKIEYEYMIIGMGHVLNYHEIPGLVEALSRPVEESPVCSNYSPKYVTRTFPAIKNFKGGNAICNFPSTPVKCPGAPQKILYMAEHHFRKSGVRQNANVMYCTSLPDIFGVKYFAVGLWKVAKDRNIDVRLRQNLIEVLPDERKAVFQHMDTGEKITLDYNFLHVCPPQSAPPILMSHKSLVNDCGYLEVDKDTLQHVRYKNIFGIGDCCNTPNSRTAAAVAAMCKVVYKNLSALMANKPLVNVYDGYASCPIITSYNTAILAEFDYNLQPKETFWFPQNVERWTMLIAKRDFMSPLYWYLFVNGWWDGPAIFRKIFHMFDKN